MESLRPFARLSACFAGAGLLVAASLPHAMVGPGQWEVGKTAGGGGEKICLPDPAMLMQAAIDLLPNNARTMHELRRSRFTRPALTLATSSLSRSLRWALATR